MKIFGDTVVTNLDHSLRQTTNCQMILLGLLASALLLGGCTQLGPNLVKAGHNEYNKAVAQTDDEQTLLNVIRFRYADNPRIRSTWAAMRGRTSS